MHNFSSDNDNSRSNLKTEQSMFQQHNLRNINNRVPNNYDTMENEGRTNAFFNVYHKYPTSHENRPFLKIHANDNNQPIYLLADSEAQRSVMREAELARINRSRPVTERIKVYRLPPKDKDRYTGANGSNREMLGWANIKMTIKGRAPIHPFLIAKHATCNMIGQDAILRLGLVIDGIKCHLKPSHQENIAIQIDSLPISQPKPRCKDNCFTSKCSMMIPAGTSKNVLCEVHTSDEWCAQPVLVEYATTSR